MKHTDMKQASRRAMWAGEKEESLGLHTVRRKARRPECEKELGGGAVSLVGPGPEQDSQRGAAWRLRGRGANS